MISKTTKVAIGLVVLGLVVASMPSGAMAGKPSPDEQNGVGKHLYKFNVIGRPNDYQGSGDDSNGRSMFISLHSENKGKSNGEPFVCESDPSYESGSSDPFYTVLDDKERIYFVTDAENDGFAMLDRDATDRDGATIQVPVGTADMKVAVRMLGKPGACADFDGIVKDECLDEEGNLVECFYWTGTIHANRKTGSPDKIDVSDIFRATGDFDQDGVIQADETDVSVFDAMFEGYFWEVTNDGLKNMQVIFYEPEA